MSVTIDLPPDLESELRDGNADAAERARELIYIARFVTGAMTHAQLADRLGLTRVELDGWLKARSVPPTYTLEDFESDMRALGELYPNREARAKEVRARQEAIRNGDAGEGAGS